MRNEKKNLLFFRGANYPLAPYTVFFETQVYASWPGYKPDYLWRSSK